MATATTIAAGSEKATLWRLIAALLLLAFSFQSYMAQTHIHDIAASSPAALIHHAGHNKAPVQNSPLDCSFCQMRGPCQQRPHARYLIRVAGAAMDEDGGAALFLANTGTAANYDWQSRAPPSRRRQGRFRISGIRNRPCSDARTTLSVRKLSSCLGMDMRRIGIFMAALLLSGCAVGPDFKKPAAPQVSGYTPTPLSTTARHARRDGRRGADASPRAAISRATGGRSTIPLRSMR